MYYTREVLTKKTSSSATVDLLQFANPFQSNVWVATLACLVIISVAVFVINYFSPYGYKDENGRATSEEFNFFNSVWFALACMLQQGGDSTPKSLSGKGGFLSNPRKYRLGGGEWMPPLHKVFLHFFRDYF